jgi:hypothetical protein
LDFFVEAFKEAFPGKRQVVALNVRRHPYRKLQDHFVISAMESRGKISGRGKELFLFGEGGERGLEGVRAGLRAEKERITRETAGMHKAAFKKAGFGTRSKSRLWRLKK